MPFTFRPKKQKVQFSDTAKSINTFKDHVQGIPCPACTQKTLKVDRLELGPKGWASDISCKNCDFKGQATNTGFAFISVSSQGKAVKPVKKDAKT